MNLVWSNTARNDLKQLRAYIGQDSPIYARQFIQRILARIETLRGFPNLGAARQPGFEQSGKSTLGDDAVWVPTVFTKNRERLIEHDAVIELFNLEQ